VSSPADVAEERNLLEEVIHELNQTWSNTLGVRIEPLRWETHAYPDAGAEPQEVINRQLGEDYDIFIGVMWGRFGTPTKNFGSGTEEEFKKAQKLYESKARRIWIMIYFKEAGISPSEIDTDQLKLVNNFRNGLGSEGVLYWKYKSRDEFTQLTRLHLSRVVQEWISEKQLAVKKAEGRHEIQKSSPEKEQVEIIELGYFDFVEISQDSLQKLFEVFSKITSYMTDLTAKAQSRTAEFSKIATLPNGPQKFQMAKRNTDFTAQDLEEFSKRFDLELPIFKSHFESLIHSLTNMAVFENQFAQQPKESLEVAANAAQALVEALTAGRGGFVYFRQSIEKLPKLSSSLNSSKRKVLGVMDRFLNNMDSSIRLTISFALFNFQIKATLDWFNPSVDFSFAA